MIFSQVNRHRPLTWFPASRTVPGVGLGRYGIVAPFGGDWNRNRKWEMRKSQSVYLSSVSEQDIWEWNRFVFQTHWICADDLGAFDERQRAGRIVKVFHVTIFTFFYHETIIIVLTSSPPSNTRSHHNYSDCFIVSDCFSLSNWFIGFFFQLFIPKITETNSCWSVRSRGDGCKRATCLTEGRNIITVSSHPPCL